MQSPHHVFALQCHWICWRSLLVLCKSTSGIILSLLMSITHINWHVPVSFLFPPLLCVKMVYCITVNSASLYFATSLGLLRRTEDEFQGWILGVFFGTICLPAVCADTSSRTEQTGAWWPQQVHSVWEADQHWPQLCLIHKQNIIRIHIICPYENMGKYIAMSQKNKIHFMRQLNLILKHNV